MKKKLGWSDLEVIFEKLKSDGYQTIAPVVKDGVISYEVIDQSSQIPQGFVEEVDAGTYKLQKVGGEARFDYKVGPTSLKRHFHPPKRKLFSVAKSPEGYQVLPSDDQRSGAKMAVFGMRSCDLAAMSVFDRVSSVFPSDGFVSNRQRDTLKIVVGCLQAGQLCFCDSMGTGPLPKNDYDLLILEIKQPNLHYLVEAKSAVGKTLIDTLGEPNEFSRNEYETKAKKTFRTVVKDPKSASAIKQLPDHPVFNEIEKRCMACANCTMVCPTCYCTTTVEKDDLQSGNAERWLTWDSCFQTDYSYIHGGSIRETTKSKYRQWLTHKFSTWHDQFGSSGCVGCGRCMAWCPVGINVVEEINKITETSEK